MTRYRAPGTLTVRQWDGESTGVARRHEAGTTHLLSAEALAVLDAAGRLERGCDLREIAHGLGALGDRDPELEASIRQIIDGLVQSGLLIAVEDDAHTG